MKDFFFCCLLLFRYQETSRFLRRDSLNFFFSLPDPISPSSIYFFCLCSVFHKSLLWCSTNIKLYTTLQSYQTLIKRDQVLFSFYFHSSYYTKQAEFQQIHCSLHHVNIKLRLLSLFYWHSNADIDTLIDEI